MQVTPFGLFAPPNTTDTTPQSYAPIAYNNQLCIYNQQQQLGLNLYSKHTLPPYQFYLYTKSNFIH